MAQDRNLDPEQESLTRDTITTLLVVDANSCIPAWRHTHHTPAYETLVFDDQLITANQDAQLVATPLPDN